MRTGFAVKGRRVAIVLHSFDRGGSGRVAGYLASGFQRLGMDVECLVFASGGPVQQAVTELIGPEVPVRYLSDRVGWRPVDLLRGLPALVRALRERPPEVLIAAANNVALVTAAAVRLARAAETRLYLKTTNPVVGSRHRGAARLLRLAGYRAAFARADGVWTLSAQETKELETALGVLGGLFRDVANPYVTPAMLAEPASGRSDRNGKVIVSVARLTRQKRLERLLRGFARSSRMDARLLILGDGEERATLEQLAAALGIADRVDMPGHVGDVAAALHAADLLVLTSDYEGLPAAVLEAMAANCPVLSTDSFPAARALLADAPGCGIIEDVAPEALGQRIDHHLAMERPTDLRAVAERYSIESGVLSHVAAMAAGEDRRARIRTQCGEGS